MRSGPVTSGKENKVKVISYILSGLLILGLAGCADRSAAPGGSGFIEADDAVVSAETGGRVLQRFFDEGTTVRQGDTLAVIDPSRTLLDLASSEALKNTTVASLQTARLQVERSGETERYARSERDRVAKLLTSGSATQKQMDQVSYDLTQAVNGLKTAQANVGVIQAQIEKTDADINRLKRGLIDCYPIAPIAGTVVEKYVEAGELLSPGKAIAKIANLDTVWVKVYLSAGNFSSVKDGDKATVSAETGGTNYAAKVVWTSSEAEFTPKNVQTEKSRANLVYAVKVRMANIDGALKIGMPVFVTLEK
jgi:HlyD family secretion protein